MSSSSPARTARRLSAALVRGMAWLALLGMFLGPLAPRPAAPRESQEADAEVVDSAEIESSASEAASRMVERRPRWRVGPPGARRWLAVRIDELGPKGSRAAVPCRVGIPRRVVPTDDDPDERLG